VGIICGARPEGVLHQVSISSRSRRASIIRAAASGQYDGWALRKFTIAPQIGVGREVLSAVRFLRAFLTYANWSDGLRG